MKHDSRTCGGPANRCATCHDIGRMASAAMAGDPSEYLAWVKRDTADNSRQMRAARADVEMLSATLRASTRSREDTMRSRPTTQLSEPPNPYGDIEPPATKIVYDEHGVPNPYAAITPPKTEIILDANGIPDPYEKELRAIREKEHR